MRDGCSECFSVSSQAMYLGLNQAYNIYRQVEKAFMLSK